MSTHHSHDPELLLPAGAVVVLVMEVVVFGGTSGTIINDEVVEAAVTVGASVLVVHVLSIGKSLNVVAKFSGVATIAL